MVELLAIDTRVAPFVGVGDLATAEHSVILGHTANVVEPLGSGCTTVLAQTATMVQPAYVVAME